jgi:hypothetical protein
MSGYRNTELPRIVVVGCGMAGMATARALRRARATVPDDGRAEVPVVALLARERQPCPTRRRTGSLGRTAAGCRRAARPREDLTPWPAEDSFKSSACWRPCCSCRTSSSRSAGASRCRAWPGTSARSCPNAGLRLGAAALYRIGLPSYCAAARRDHVRPGRRRGRPVEPLSQWADRPSPGGSNDRSDPHHTAG